MATVTPAAAVLEVALTTNPTEAPVWTDLTPYLQAFSIQRGRAFPLEPAAASTARITLDNRDRRFDPRNAAGSYYPNLRPMRRVRLRGTFGGSTTDLWHGYVDGWPQSREGYGDQVVELSCSDFFKIANLDTLTATYSAERSDVRVGNVLTALNWTTGQAWLLEDATYGLLGTSTYLGPLGDRALDAGLTAVQASTLTDTNALVHLQAVEATEDGRLFVSKDGAVTFHNRHRRLVAQGTPVAIFGDDLSPGSGELPYAGPPTLRDADDATLWNRVVVTPNGGAAQEANDPLSVTLHFRRVLSRDTLHETTTAGLDEAHDQATYLLNRYSYGVTWIVGLQLDPEDESGLVWPQLLERELGDVVTVRYTPLGGGARVEQVSLLEGIALSYRADGPQWLAEWNLSAADTAPYWVLDTTGVLDSSAALAY